MASIHLTVFYPDGNAPETADYPIARLSAKWLKVCADLLADSGPVFVRNMGSTLSQFDIRMGGPVGELLIHGKRAFEFAISRGNFSTQDIATIDHFTTVYRKACSAAGSSICEKSLAAIRDSASKPSLLLFDYSDVDASSDKEAIMQLGLHLAAAYLRYLETEANQRVQTTAMTHPPSTTHLAPLSDP